ncbi:MAG: hypothetical protein SPJ13_06400 [Bacteroidales bacterium]|nr:hypothetical protein [Bacteroidales bacterium]
MNSFSLFRNLVLAAAALLLCSACGKKPIFEETHSLNNQTWLRFEPEKYEFNVKNIDDCYDITLIARIDTTLVSFTEIPLIVDMYNESSEHRMLPLKMRTRDNQGKWQGKTLGCYVDITVPIRRYFYFNAKGLQRVEIKQATSKYELHGVSALTITVKKSDLRDK